MARATKIIGEIQDLVCNLHVQGYSDPKIAEAVREKGIEINRKSIWAWLTSAKNQPIIAKYREKFLLDPLSVDIAHKKVRLIDLNRERVSIVRTLQTFKDKDGMILQKKFKKYVWLLKRLIEVEREGRDEIEKKPDMVAFFQRIGPFSEVTDADLRNTEKEVDEQLRIIATTATVEGKGDNSKGAGTSVKRGPA